MEEALFATRNVYTLEVWHPYAAYVPYITNSIWDIYAPMSHSVTCNHYGIEPKRVKKNIESNKKKRKNQKGIY